MPKELSKCREWEKERRNRLNEAFAILCKLLPCYDPAVNTSKIDILKNAASYIEELQTKIKDLITENKEESNNKIKGEEYRKLHDRIKRLLSKNEQLCSLLREAKITIPSECIFFKKFRAPPSMCWSNRILPEQAKILQRKEIEKENDASGKSAPRKFPKKKQNKVGQSTPKHRKAILNRSDRKIRPPKKKKVKPLTSSKCVIVLSQPTVTQPCYVITNAPSNNVLGGSSTVITNSTLVANPLVSSKPTKTLTAVPQLGPGTLILANGTMVSVLPQQPVLPLPSQIITRPPLILLQNKPGNVNTVTSAVSSEINKIVTTGIKTLSRIRPKYCLTKTTQVNKVPIPALTSRYSNPEVVLKKVEQKVVKSKPLEKKAPAKEDEKKESVAEKRKATTEVTTSSKKQKTVEEVPTAQKTPEEESTTKKTEVEVVPTASVEKSNAPENVEEKKDESSNNKVEEKKNDAVDLNINHSELSNDIFASLQVPSGCQNPESASPTAAFLLAFPLVSSLTGVKVTEVPEEENADSQRGTPTLLQIGTMDNTKPTQSESLTPSLLNLDNLSFFSSKDISGFYNSFENTITNNRNSVDSVVESGANSEVKQQNEIVYQQAKSHNQPEKQIIQPQRNIFQHQQGKTQLQHPPQHIQQQNQQLKPSNTQLHQPNQQLSQPSQSNHQHQQIQQPNQQIQKPSRQIQQPSQQIQQPNQQIQQPSQQIQQPNHQHQQPNQQIQQPKHQLQKPGHHQQSSQHIQQSGKQIQTSQQLQHQQSNQQIQQPNQQRPQSKHQLQQLQLPAQQFKQLQPTNQQLQQPSQHHHQQSKSLQTPMQQSLQQSQQNHQQHQPHKQALKQPLQSIQQHEKNLVPCFDNQNTIPSFASNLLNYQPKQNVAPNIDTKVATNYNTQKSFCNSFETSKISTTCTYANAIKNYPEPLYTNSTSYAYNNSSDFNFNQNYYKDITKTDNRNYYSLNYENYADYRKSESNTYFSTSNYYTNYSKDKFNSSNNQKNKNSASTQVRPTINWMTTPDNRLQTPTDYVLPQFTKESEFYPTNSFTTTQTTYPMYSNEVPTQETRKGLDLALVPSMNTYQSNDMENNQFSWSPTKIPQFLDPPHSFVSSTLPTLVGDLALGNPLTFDQKNEKCANNKKENRRPKNFEGQGNFLSVSQLVDHNKEPVPARTTTRRNSGNRSSGKKVPQKSVQRKEKDTSCKIDNSTKMNNKQVYSSTTEFCDSNNKNRNVKNSYSAEALIGQMQSSGNDKNRQNYPSNKPISVSSFLHDNIIPYFPPVDLPQDNTYMQPNQNFQTTFSHNFPSSFQNNTYTANTFIPSTNTISTSYNFMHDVSHDYSDNLNLFPVNKEKTVKNGNKNVKEQCSTTPKKNKRKHTTELPGFVDFPFLSMPGSINSPILPDDFHAHTGFLQPTPQLYPCKNPFTKPNDIASASLLPLPPVPVTRSHIQHPEISPGINSAGTSLTNFNLSTIFPEINNKSALSDPFSETRGKEQARNFTSAVQVTFNDKPTFSFSYINCSTSQTYNNL